MAERLAAVPADHLHQVADRGGAATPRPLPPRRQAPTHAHVQTDPPQQRAATHPRSPRHAPRRRHLRLPDAARHPRRPDQFRPRTEAAALTPSQRAALESYYGLDQPLFVQFFSWLGNIFTGNLGFSSRAQTSVLDLTAAALPVTFELAIFSIVIALAIGIPLGMLSASKPDSFRDGVGQVVGLAGLSIPRSCSARRCWRSSPHRSASTPTARPTPRCSRTRC